MRKNCIAKKFITLAVAVIMVVSLFSSVLVSAEYISTVRLIKLDEASDFSFLLLYDKEFPNVVLISPNDDRYDLSMSSENITVTTKNNYTAVTVKNGEAGQWKLEYDRDIDNSLSYQVANESFTLYINEFNASYSDITKNLTVSFKPEINPYYDNNKYNYTVKLVSVKGGVSYELKYQYSASANDEVLLENISLENYPAYDDYVVILEASSTFNSGRTTFFATAESPSFSITSTEYLTAPDNITVAADGAKNSVTVDWSNITADTGYYSPDKYTVVLLDENGNELDSFSTKEKGQKTFIVPDDHKKVKIAVTYVYDNKLSAPFEKEVELTEVIAPSEAPSQSKAVAVELTNISDNMQITAGEFTVKGKASGAASVTVNGEPAQLLEDGSFSVKLNFSEGRDQAITVIADSTRREYRVNVVLADTAAAVTDNASQDEADQESAKVPFWVPLAVGVALAVTMIVFAIVLAKKKSKLKTFSFVPFVVLFAFTTVFSGAILVIQILKRN